MIGLNSATPGVTGAVGAHEDVQTLQLLHLRAMGLLRRLVH